MDRVTITLLIRLEAIHTIALSIPSMAGTIVVSTTAPTSNSNSNATSGGSPIGY